jgi:signal transduction histidine kinase
MKLLIIDDEPLNAMLLEALLSEAGYDNFKSSTDSRQTLRLCQEFQPDLILLDLMMPHLDGFGVMQQLAIPADVFLPILVLTADVNMETRRRALAAGATDFLTKPFDHTEVLLRVKNLLHARHQHLQLQNQNEILEQKVHERTRELRHSQHQIIQQERMRALGLMASGVAHDFNNALSVIMGFGEIVLNQCRRMPGGQTLAQDMQTLIVAAEDAAMMVDRLREFHRPNEAEELHAPVDLNALVKQAVSLTQPRWKNQVLRNGATIRMNADLEKIPQIAGDAAELREALTNLIFNAVDAMPGNGTITFKTRIEAGHVLLQVSDTGTGMSEEVRQRCMEPFFTTKGEHGTGLGLAMVYGILQRHGATLSIESALGKGTTFTCRFPIKTIEWKLVGIAPATLGQPLRVLVVDDQPVLCEITAQHLTLDWHTVETAENGHAALEKFKAGDFDLVITDQAMPEMNGDQLALAIKQLKPAIPVIMLTGFGDEAGERCAAIDLVLNKPVSHLTLRQALVKVMTDEAL